ncbi:hypothetical protein KW782_01580 [Candidatus Parcubacteria bacterium]|nr:hypothetical protein [Candidatus Parcubacteria bacterium]
MEQNNQGGKQGPTTTVKVLVLLGLIVLLVLGILLPIKLVPNAVTSTKSFFSRIFNRDSVTLEVDKDELNSGEPFVLSWNGGTRENGSYILSYSCIDGVRIETSVNQPFERITCDSQFYFSPTENEIELTVVSERSREVDIPVTLSFLENSASEPTELGTISLFVTNPAIDANAPLPTATPTPRPSTTPTPSATPKPTPKPAAPAPVKTTPQKVSRPSNPNGQPDLAVQILEVGYLNPQTNKFVPFHAATSNMRAAVKFVVINNGDKNTGNWSFKATLPSDTNPTYTAVNRENLGPGDGIEYVLGFERLNNTRDNTITIVVDPENQIYESRENNNSYSAKITNPQAGTSYNPYYPNNNSGTVINTYGKPDLAVSLVDARVENSNRAVIQFEVRNIGDRPTGSFRFRANLPSSGNSEFTSSYMNSLEPSARVTFTVNFENLQNYGNNTATITIDPYNEVSETNEGNNSLTATVYRY